MTEFDTFNAYKPPTGTALALRDLAGEYKRRLFSDPGLSAREVFGPEYTDAEIARALEKYPAV